MSKAGALIALICLASCIVADPPDPADLIELTGLDNQEIYLNGSAVVDLRGTPDERKGLIHGAAKCLVFTLDGKFVSVIQTCAQVRALLRAANGPAK